MNTEKLKKLEAEVRIGGKGTARRKKKVVRASSSIHQAEEKNQLKKISFQPVPNVAEVMLHMEDGGAIKIPKPNVSVSFGANTTSVSGRGQVMTPEEVRAETEEALSMVDVFSKLEMIKKLKQGF